MKNFKIVNGRWTINNEKLNPLEAVQFESVLIKVRFFAGDKKLSHDKVNILMNLLDSKDEEIDEIISFVIDNKSLSKKVIGI